VDSQLIEGKKMKMQMNPLVSILNLIQMKLIQRVHMNESKKQSESERIEESKFDLRPLRNCAKQLTVSRCHHPQLFARYKRDPKDLLASGALIATKNFLNICNSSKKSKPANKKSSEGATCSGQRILQA
jgi:membrane-bound lytic murein transglycosylase MltF